MTHILKNKNLEIKIDLPLENYNFSRFDWTGKIADVKFKNIQLATVERTDGLNENSLGKGFYNEFGIDTALGFDDTEIGGWFHKIGVGLLKKEDSQYLFSKNYEVKPAEFKINVESDRILIRCKSEVSNGYAYLLQKEIHLAESGFTLKYYLQNTGEKEFSTDEYVHNFTAINNDLIGSKYVLKFPFQLKPESFGEAVNPELKVAIGQNEIKFKGTPEQQFFFSNLSGDKNVDASWQLINLESKIAISESGSFQTNKVNLWGWKHVICPELFYKINLKPGQSTEWTRKYKLQKTD